MRKILISIVFLFLAVLATVAILNKDYFVSQSNFNKSASQAALTKQLFLSFLEKEEVKDFSGTTTTSMQKLNAEDTVIVHFWASWCEPCVAEIPELLEYMIKNPSYKLFVVSQDDSENDILKFLKSFPGLNSENFIRIWDKEKRFAKYFNVDRLPMSVIFTPHKKEPQIFRSAVDWKSLKLTI